MEAWVSRARAQEVQKRWGIADVPVVDMVKDVRACGDVSCVLVGADGSRYREVDTNVWMRDGEAVDAVWVNTGKHGGGITLRPLYVPVEGEWVNVATGRPAPGELRLPAPSASKSAPSETPTPLSFDASWRNKCEGLVRICEASTWAVDSGAVLPAHDRHGGRRAPMRPGTYEPACGRRGEFRRLRPPFRRRGPRSGFLPRGAAHHHGALLPAEARGIIVMDFANPHREDEIPEANREAVTAGASRSPSCPRARSAAHARRFSRRSSTTTRNGTGLSCWLSEGFWGLWWRRVQATRKSMDLEILCDRRRLGDEIASSVASLASNLSVGVDSVLESYEKGDDAAVRANLERLGEGEPPGHRGHA